MNTTIIPVTEARGKLGDLTEKVSKEKYIILTKSGSPKAALVDLTYLTRLQKDARQLYQKTFLDPRLLKYTREFTTEEVEEWQKEDTL